MICLLVEPETKVPHRAGQHYEIRFPGDELGRKYSIVSPPGERAPLEFGVQILAKGLVSPRLACSLPGTPIELRGPLGEAFTWSPDAGPSLILIGGGAGITPLLSIYGAFTHAYPRGTCRFLLSAKRPDLVYHLDRYERILITRYTGTAPRFTAADLADLLGELLHDPTAAARICGPGGMIDSVVDNLVDLGFPEDRIRSEAFV